MLHAVVSHTHFTVCMKYTPLNLYVLQIVQVLQRTRVQLATFRRSADETDLRASNWENAAIHKLGVPQIAYIVYVSYASIPRPGRTAPSPLHAAHYRALVGRESARHTERIVRHAVPARRDLAPPIAHALPRVSGVLLLLANEPLRFTHIQPASRLLQEFL